MLRLENGILDRPGRVCGAALRHDRFSSIHGVTPRASVPMIVPNEPKNSWAGFVERDIMRVVDLPYVMRRVCEMISAGAVESALHVSPNTEPQCRPLLPFQERVITHGNDRWFRCVHRRSGIFMRENNSSRSKEKHFQGEVHERII